MTKTFVLLLVLFAPGMLVAQPSSGSHPLVFIHANLIDVTRGAVKSDMAVVIVGTRIAQIGKSGKVRIPQNALVIDASGRFLIPGLWNMHAHLGSESFDRDFHLRLYIANGVTGVRFMDGDDAYHSWRKEAARGGIVAPRMVIASDVIGFGNLSNLSEADSREQVRRAKREGADFIKVHDNISRESYFALVDEAARVGLEIAGHVPSSITAIEAANSGQKSIEHFTGLAEAASNETIVKNLTAVLKRNHTWFCPTLIMRTNYASLHNPALVNDPRSAYVKPSWKRRWLNMTREAVKTPVEEWSKRRETIEKEKALVQKMQRAGVGILAGTDDANPYVVPGFSLHDELTLLVKAGLTPLEALRTATINPARFLSREKDLGTIGKNKLADLVLLNANPLTNISNTKAIEAVVLNGRLFDRTALNRMLSEAAAAANSN